MRINLVQALSSSSYQGLTSEEVLKSREKHGSNGLTKVKKKSFLKQFLLTFGDPIIKILMIALAVNIIFLFRSADWFETIGIAIAVLISTIVTTVSEYGSQSAFEKLQEEASKIKCRVKRNGGISEIPVSEIVVGDLILLEEGDRIPADGIIIMGEIDVNQSALNGETKEVRKKSSVYTEHITNKIDLLNENLLFSGCIVCAGEGLMQVKSVGDNTFYGTLAKEIQEENRESPLKVRLTHLAKVISKIGYIGAAIVAAAYLFNGFIISSNFNGAEIISKFSDINFVINKLMYAITLAVSVIVVSVPEGLPMMITIVLSANMKRMLKDNIFVRKLVSIETSGSLNVLFTDKTGTITQGKLLVNCFVTGNNVMYDNIAKLQQNKLIWEKIYLTTFYNNASIMVSENNKSHALGGNATDRTLLEYISQYPVNFKNIKKTVVIPFKSNNKYSVTHIKNENIDMSLVKGAAEKLLPLCENYYDENGKTNSLNSQNKKELFHRIKELSDRGMRLLVIACKNSVISGADEISNLTLVGIMGIRDEIRKEAKTAITQLHRAGIRVIMITGDSKDTAIAIAKETNLLKENEESGVITSDELKFLSDAELKKIFPKLRVVSRALPSDKSRLVNIAQELGYVAGMTGDGINDAPALNKADVGFCMGSGTDIAKEAGDIVILDDNLSSIAKAILYGRTIFKSIRKFIIFQLTVNICAVSIAIIGPFIGIEAPVTVVQMLWINMVMDTLAGLAFGGEPPLAEYMNEKPKVRDEKIINRYMWGEIFITGILTSVMCLLFLKLPVINSVFRTSENNLVLMTGFFLFFIFAGIFNSFSARTSRLNLFSNLLRNKMFIIVMSLIAIIQIVLIFTGGAVFRTTPLTLKELLFSISFAALVIPIDLIRKIILKKRRQNTGV